jgi:3-hydroxyacyl-CoA dehydrogenase
MQRFVIKKVAVLGAGVMGAQIAAHLANANVQPILFDLADTQTPVKNGVVLKALEGLAKLEPSPIGSKSRLAMIEPANYDEHLPRLAECDLIIEAISERMDWKKSLYEKVAPHIRPDAIFASNTSGLSITELSKVFPEALRHRFCGVHFFNPPRYMKLVELIPTAQTELTILDQLETFLVTTLGKGVVRASDTPNFVANRIGVFSMAATMHHTAAFALSFDEVDALTGPAIGRAKSATYRTADVVGLDTMAHTIKTMQDQLPDDPWHRYYAAPPVLKALVEKGLLGQKSKMGFYTKRGKDILVLDPAKQDYVAGGKGVADEVAAILKVRNPADQFAQLRASSHPQAQFLWSIFRDLWHYCAVHLGDVAQSARDIDLAIRWGFGWKMGPFETWQAAGWETVAKWIAEDIAAGKTIASAALPAWVTDGRKGVHTAEGSFSARTGKAEGASALAVYQRHLFPEKVLGEATVSPAKAGTTVFETDDVRMWTHPAQPTVAIASIKSKMHSLGAGVLAGITRAVHAAEQQFAGLVIWQEAPFAVGANLAEAIGAIKAGQFEAFEAMVANFQATSLAIRYSQIPVVAAVDGMALGGGCEFAIYSNKRVATFESYIGLVEVGVGLLPAGGGCALLGARAARDAAAHGYSDSFPILQKYFRQIAMGEVSKSADQAREMGYLREGDVIVFNPQELLFAALTEAKSMADNGYRPPLPAKQIPVAGYTGIATLKMMLINMKAGGFISEHDYEIGSRVATVLCGGEVEPGSMVDEEWLIKLERQHFVALAKMPKTQDRIEHMLKTGKPLRN